MRKVWAVAAALLVGSCGEPDRSAPPASTKTEAHPYGATPYTEAEKADIARRSSVSGGNDTERRADEVMACGLALLQAEDRDLVASDAQVPPPWKLTTDTLPNGRRVSCEGRDQRGRFTVVVDLLCTDVNDDQCHPLVAVNR